MRFFWLHRFILTIFIFAFAPCGAQSAEKKPNMDDISRRLKSSLQNGWELTGSKEISSAKDAPWASFFRSASAGYVFGFENRDQSVECSSSKGAKASVKVHPDFRMWVIRLSPTVTLATLQKDYEDSRRSPIQTAHPTALGASREMAMFLVNGCGDVQDKALSNVSKEFHLKPLDRQ